MVGHTDSDIQAGTGRGLLDRSRRAPGEHAQRRPDTRPDAIVPDLRAAAKWILDGGG